MSNSILDRDKLAQPDGAMSDIEIIVDSVIQAEVKNVVDKFTPELNKYLLDIGLDKELVDEMVEGISGQLWVAFWAGGFNMVSNVLKTIDNNF